MLLGNLESREDNNKRVNWARVRSTYFTGAGRGLWMCHFSFIPLKVGDILRKKTQTNKQATLFLLPSHILLASCKKRQPLGNLCSSSYFFFLQIEPGSVAYLDGRLTLCDVVLKVWITVLTFLKLCKSLAHIIRLRTSFEMITNSPRLARHATLFLSRRDKLSAWQR